MNGLALYRARLAKGMTLRDVSAECHRRGCKLDPSNLARVENGATKQISPRKIPTLLAVLDLSIEEVIPGEAAA